MFYVENYHSFSEFFMVIINLAILYSNTHTYTHCTKYYKKHS